MQYSRYYHLLNVAIQYDYPELTKTSRGFTTGLYTEGRFQSDLSKQSKAKSQFELLMKKCTEYNINLALSYAYPQNKKTQATDRYTISIEELIDMAKSTFSPELVKVSQINYNHTNHKNKHNKPVIEYLILCGKNKKVSRTYDISNFKKTIYDMKPTNRNPVYNTHLYWSQKSFNIIDALIENFSDQNNVIFDPFLGSGVTILEAIKKETNRNAIGCDVNECPVFIVKTLLNDSFSQNAEHELKRFMEFINTLQRYYTINCPNCSNKAIIDRIIFDKPERSKSDVSIKAVNIKCMTCNTKNIDPKSYDFASDMFQIYRYSNINSEFEYIKNSKIAVIENDRITNIFTSRNLKVIDEIISMSLSFSKETQNIIKYVLMSIMHQCKISDKRSNSQWPLWVPKKDCVERNVICLLQGKMNGFIKALKTIRTNYKKGSIVENFSEIKQNNALILHKGSQLITDEEVPDNSVDLIITDPPYLEQVLYSEYMQLYAPILNLDFNLEDEIVVSTGENREKDKTNYYELLGSVFSLCRDKLKKNKLMCLYFHDSNLDVWYRLIKILYELGFDFKGQVHIKKNVTLKNIISPQKSLNGDSILFFNNSKRTRDYVGGSESIEEIELNLVREAKFMISNSGPLSTPELYDNGLMEILIQNGWLKKAAEEYKTLIDVFQKHLLWDKELAKWYIKTKE
jgi:DNA modification methylase